MFPGFAGTIDITGNLFGGGTIATSINVGDTFSFYSLAGFSNLASVVFAESISGVYRTTPGLSLDNLTVNQAAIPEPTSLALLGMTAVGFCGVRLRRRRQAGTADSTQAA